MDILEGPRVVEKPDTSYAGIRLVTPFRGMLAVRDRLMADLYGWLDERGLVDVGSTFLRLHVIDMAGAMDIEVGVATTASVDGDDRVRPGTLPAGRYASLTYVNHARRANQLLLNWVRDNSLAADRSSEPAGDRFRCRYEAYLTDPRSEPMKTKWRVELNIRLADHA